MASTEHGVTSYVTGYVELKVSFPNGQVCCDFCPGCNRHTANICRCMWLGGQAFASADAQYGVLPNCPIRFSKDANRAN